MTSRELFQAGKLKEAIAALTSEVRDNPTDARRRTFLFELLCFAGEYERAVKQLNILSDETVDTQVGALLYRSALAAEKSRQDMFQDKAYTPPSAAAAVPGTINGRAFKQIEDADARIGARLEVFIAGQYMVIPFESIASIQIAPPKQLRDLMWASALVQAGPALKGKEIGEVLVPVNNPLSWQHEDDLVKLGRLTDWREVDGEAVPLGQKMLVVDGEEEIPFLEIRSLEFSMSESASNLNATA